MLFPNPQRSLGMLVVPVLWLLRSYVARRTPHPSTLAKHPRRGTSSLPHTPLNSAILLIALMLLVSTWATYDLALSLSRISGLVLGLGVYFAVVRESVHVKGWWLGTLLFLGMGLVIAALGLFGTNWFSTKLILLNPLTSRIPTLLQGLPGDDGAFHPNQVAGTLSWVLPVLLTLGLSLRAQRSKLKQDAEQTAPSTPIAAPRSHRLMTWGIRLLLWLSTTFVTGVFILTQSRSAYIGMAITILGMFLLALPARWRWGLLGLLVAVGLLLGFSLGREALAQFQDWAMDDGLVSENAFSLNSFEGRLELWSRAIYGLQDFPFTGMGMHTFQEVVHVLYPLFLVAPDVDIGHAHNEFLQAGLDLGIPGMIALMALNIGAFWMLGWMWKAVGHNPARCDYPFAGLSVRSARVFVLGLGGGLLAHLIYGLLNAAPLGAKPGIFFWMLLGLIAGLYQQGFSTQTEISTAGRQNQRWSAKSALVGKISAGRFLKRWSSAAERSLRSSVSRPSALTKFIHSPQPAARETKCSSAKPTLE